MDNDNWVNASRIGYFGNMKSRIDDFLTGLHGKAWRVTHLVDGKPISEEESLRLYEDSYVNFLKNNSKVLDWLVNHASDVYDNSKTNMDSGTDYKQQESTSIHLQDIAVRKAVSRLGYEFKGNDPVEIRGAGSEGYVLNPGRIPFIDISKIMVPNRSSWYRNDSLEGFWQENKVLQLKDDYFRMILQDDSLIPPGNTYSVGNNELDMINIQFCEFGKSEPTLFATGRLESIKGDDLYFLKINPPYDSAVYLSPKEFGEHIKGNFDNIDFVLRIGEQLPKGTIDKLKRFSKNVNYLG
jgi:hypothetical protein